MVLSIGLILLIALPLCLGAQETEAANLPDLEHLLALSLKLATEGKWDEALASLDRAELIAPEDPRVSSYRASIIELKALESVQSGEKDELPSEEGSDEETPKFVIERDENDVRHDPGQFRDQFRGDLNFRIFVHNPLDNRLVNTWSSLEAFAYSSLAADLRYWLPFLGRSLGVNFRSSGYSWSPGEPEILFNTLDLGINLRGFLAESPASRLEIGLDFGASLQSKKTLVNQTVSRNAALFLGLWLSDPILYHIFKVENLENLVFGGGIRTYSTIVGDEFIETVTYGIDGAWRFKNAQAGMRLEWWNFKESEVQRSILSFTLFFGIHF